MLINLFLQSSEYLKKFFGSWMLCSKPSQCLILFYWQQSMFVTDLMR